MASANQPPGKKSFAKHAAMQLVAGGSAGCIEVCIMHPLDLVKTRIQIQATKPNAAAAAVDPTHYNGIVDCMRKMYRTEGVTSFWKGIIPPILVETPKRAWKFFTFEQFKTLFKFTPDQNQALTFSLAGLGSGVTEAIIVNPFEVVKVRMQSNRAKGTAAPSTFAVAKEIAKADGWLRHGLLGKGITATMGRNGTFNMIYFGFYHTVREYLPVLENPRAEFAKKFAIGFTAGTLASCCNIPFDVAKSRIQGPQPEPGKVYYRGTFRTIGMVYNQEGFRALYKGLLPKVLRLGPGGAILLLVYEKVYNMLLEQYPD